MFMKSKNSHRKFIAGAVILATLPFVLTGCHVGSSSSGDYYNDSKIASSNSFSCRKGWNGNPQDDGKSYAVQVEGFDGNCQLAVADVETDCDGEINFSINANSGKAKLVLVDPNLNVKVLKEVNAQNEHSYSGNISVHCSKGSNVIKIVAENYSGDFKISQQDMLFKYSDGVKEFEKSMDEMSRDLEHMFDDDFPFGSRKKSKRMFDDDFPFGSVVNV